MPTYTYVCQRCAHEFEIVQSMTDPPRKRCPECRGAVRRTFHPVGIVLKGSGFHKTDYAPKSSSSGSDKSSESKDTSSSDSSKTKNKPESKKKSDSGGSGSSSTSDAG